MKHLWWPSSSQHSASLMMCHSVPKYRFWTSSQLETVTRHRPFEQEKHHELNKNHLLTHEKIGFRCRLAIVLLDVFGLVGDHADERVELKDGDAQIDDVHWVSKEALQCRNKFCKGEFMDTTSNIGFYTWWTFIVGLSSSFDNLCISTAFLTNMIF